MYSMAYLDGNAGERRPLTFIYTYCIFFIGYMQSVKTNVRYSCRRYPAVPGRSPLAFIYYNNACALRFDSRPIR